MTSTDELPYLIPHAWTDEGDGWASPGPADQVITDAVVAATDLDADDVDDLSAYVSVPALAAVLDGEGDELSFTVETADVVVTGDGSVDVSAE